MSDSVPMLFPRLRLHQTDIRDLMHIRLFKSDYLIIPANSWNTQNVQSPFWRFYLNRDRGAFITLREEERFAFEPDRIYFVPSGVRFSCGNDLPFRHFYVHFDMIGLSRLTMQLLFDGPVELSDDVSFSAAVISFAEMLSDREGFDVIQQCRAKSLVYEGLARCLASFPEDVQRKIDHQSVSRESITPALLAMEENLALPLSVAYLAGLCCLSPDHFGRRFRAIIGQTPNDYLREQRVIKAAQMLLFTDKSLEEIARDCGFGSRHYLTRVFTDRMGVPPVAYRRGRG